MKFKMSSRRLTAVLLIPVLMANPLLAEAMYRCHRVQGEGELFASQALTLESGTASRPAIGNAPRRLAGVSAAEVRSSLAIPTNEPPAEPTGWKDDGILFDTVRAPEEFWRLAEKSIAQLRKFALDANANAAIETKAKTFRAMTPAALADHFAKLPTKTLGRGLGELSKDGIANVRAFLAQMPNGSLVETERRACSTLSFWLNSDSLGPENIEETRRKQDAARETFAYFLVLLERWEMQLVTHDGKVSASYLTIERIVHRIGIPLIGWNVAELTVLRGILKGEKTAALAERLHVEVSRVAVRQRDIAERLTLFDMRLNTMQSQANPDAIFVTDLALRTFERDIVQRCGFRMPADPFKKHVLDDWSTTDRRNALRFFRELQALSTMSARRVVFGGENNERPAQAVHVTPAALVVPAGHQVLQHSWLEKYRADLETHLTPEPLSLAALEVLRYPTLAGLPIKLLVEKDAKTWIVDLMVNRGQVGQSVQTKGFRLSMQMRSDGSAWYRVSFIKRIWSRSHVLGTSEQMTHHSTDYPGLVHQYLEDLFNNPSNRVRAWFEKLPREGSVTLSVDAGQPIGLAMPALIGAIDYLKNKIAADDPDYATKIDYVRDVLRNVYRGVESPGRMIFHLSHGKKPMVSIQDARTAAALVPRIGWTWEDWKPVGGDRSGSIRHNADDKRVKLLHFMDGSPVDWDRFEPKPEAWNAIWDKNNHDIIYKIATNGRYLSAGNGMKEKASDITEELGPPAGAEQKPTAAQESPKRTRRPGRQSA